MSRISHEILQITQSLQKIVDTEYAGNATELARKVGEEASTFSRIMNGFSKKGANRVVRALVEIGFDEDALRSGDPYPAHDVIRSGDNPHSKFADSDLGELDDTQDNSSAVNRLESLVVNVINWGVMREIIALGGDDPEKSFVHSFGHVHDREVFDIRVTVEVSRRKPSLPPIKKEDPASGEARS